MTGVVTIVCLAFAVLTMLGAGIRAQRDQTVGRPESIAAALLELGVLVYVIVRVVDLVGGHRTSSTVIVVVYLVGIVLVMPIAGVLAVAERSRWGPIVLGFGALVVCVLFARLDQIWSLRG